MTPTKRPSTRQLANLVERINATASKCDGKPRGAKYPTRSTIPDRHRCARCWIGIFANEVEAAKCGTAFIPALNLRVGGYCVGCAGVDGVTVEQLAELIPAAPPEPQAPPAALLAAHADYWQSGDYLSTVEKRHRIRNLSYQFRQHGLPVRKKGPRKRKEAAACDSDLRAT